MAASFPEQVVAVVFRRAAVFQPEPGELATFPGRVIDRAIQRPHLGLAVAAVPAIPAATPENDAAASRRLGSQILAAIERRARAHDLASTLAAAHSRAHRLAIDLRRDLDPDLDLDPDIGIPLDRVSYRAEARALAVTLGRALAVTTDPALVGDPDLDRALVYARQSALALDHALDRNRAIDRELAPQLAGGLRNSIARALELALPPVVIDASGADLSGGNFSDLSLLEGVIWTRETVWPPGVAEQVERLSEETSPDVFRVRGGTERDPSLVDT